MPSPAEQHGPGERRGAEAAAHVVERGVQRAGATAIERQRQLHGVVVVEVGDGDADERHAPLVDERAGRGDERADGGQHGPVSAVGRGSVCDRVARV